MAGLVPLDSHSFAVPFSRESSTCLQSSSFPSSQSWDPARKDRSYSDHVLQVLFQKNKDRFPLEFPSE